MKAVYKKRLMKLVEILRRDARNKKGLKFDMDTWGLLDEYNPTHDKPVVPKMSCGTQACALGAAAISGEFRGLSARVPANTVWMEFLVNGSVVRAEHAAKVTFGLSSDQIDYLFMPDWYPSNMLEGAEGERFVANRIAKFVRDNGKIPE